MNLRKFLSFLIFLAGLFPCMLAQEVPHPVTNFGVYELLDELANLQVISINSAIKPYSRMFIAKKLKEAESKKEILSRRQANELEFYLKDFGKELTAGENWERRKDLFYHKDSLFSLTINPILGGEIFNNAEGNATYWRNGAEARGYVGNWGFYASLRDNHEKPQLRDPEYLTNRAGDYYKDETDWSEMQGGITYSWAWGNAGLIKEMHVWGNSYNGANIFGGNNPTFVQFRLQINPVKWFSFNFFHGWLNSMVVDSSGSYWVNNSYGLRYRRVYHKKFISANMFTFTPLRYINLSLGNSIVYSDENINPAYIMPLFFYKSVDESLRWGIDNMNSQMFIDMSSRQIRHLHVYTTLFIDELSVARFRNDKEWNFLSWKAGFKLSDLLISGLSFTTELTYTYPMTFRHYVPTTTFETSGYNLGHYLKDNSREWHLALEYKPLRATNIKIYYTDAVRGPDYVEIGEYSRKGNPPLDSISWKSSVIGISVAYQVMNDVYVWASASMSEISGDIRWNPVYFQGTKNNLNLGVTIGF